VPLTGFGIQTTGPSPYSEAATGGDWTSTAATSPGTNGGTGAPASTAGNGTQNPHVPPGTTTSSTSPFGAAQPTGGGPASTAAPSPAGVPADAYVGRSGAAADRGASDVYRGDPSAIQPGAPPTASANPTSR
jgi:hypothetical protein